MTKGLGFLLATVALVGTGCNLGSSPQDSAAPQIQFISPAGDRVGGTVTIEVVIDDESDLRYVRFYIDDVLLLDASSPPWRATWVTGGYPDGLHTIRVDAEDVTGNRASASREVTVANTPN